MTTLPLLPPPPPEAKCIPPEPPEHSIMTGEGPHHIGDVVEFKCETNYMMEGQPVIMCQEDGTWSFEVPKCEYIEEY